MTASPARNTLRPSVSAGLDDATFARVVRLASGKAGLMITAEKRILIQARLARRMRALGIDTPSAYMDLIEGPDGGDEIHNMISALTTNVSHFYRERHHFDMLRQNILPALLERAAAGGSVRIWSAGCAAGQEPYSIAMEVLRLDKHAAEKDILILGTDIDRVILATAREAVFAPDTITGVAECDRHAFFEDTSDGRFRVRSELRDLVRFRELNLLAHWPMKRRFDVIFCRNVVIYFSNETQMHLWPRFCDALVPGGTIFLGHAERIPKAASLNLRSVGVTTYRRDDPEGLHEPTH